jgi:hypothetical protein
MSTRFINKYAGATATNKPISRSAAAGIGYDTVAAALAYDNAGTIVPILDGTSVQTVTNKNYVAPTITQAVDGAIVIATSMIWLTKGSPAAMTLAAPTAAQVGTEITVMAGSAFAHVVTATGLLNNGTTGGPHNTYTTAAFKGSGATFIATPDLLWVVASQQLGSVA